MAIKAIIIEDNPTTMDVICQSLEATEDIEILGTAANATLARELIGKGGFDIMLCDLGLPDGSGIDLIKYASKLFPEADIIVITIFAEQSKVLGAIKAGARGYLVKDEHLGSCVNAIRETRAGGSSISPLIARQLLQQLQPNTNELDDPLLEPLSSRETDVLNLLARGFTYAEIAGFLTLSEHTIRTYVRRIYHKLQVNSRSEAVFEASSRGIIDFH
ncbi:MAG: LuxR family transcriptional regulator [Hyphomonadaceae bacterium]|nr:MAG: LuxR family transcriptional regulator [Hyphomonadaceae bacterium]